MKKHKLPKSPRKKIEEIKKRIEKEKKEADLHLTISPIGANSIRITED